MNEIDRLLEEEAAYLTTAKAMSNLEVRAWYERKAAERFKRVLRLASLRGYWLGAYCRWLCVPSNAYRRSGGCPVPGQPRKPDDRPSETDSCPIPFRPTSPRLLAD